MRISFYIISSLLLLLALLGFISTLGIRQTGNESVDYNFACSLLVGGTLILFAAIENYRGGFWFLSASLLGTLSFFLIWFTYGYYQRGQFLNFEFGVSVIVILTIISGLLARVGHKRHSRLSALENLKAVSIGVKSEHLASQSEEISIQTKDAITVHSPLVLYPPMPLWRVFLLLMFSAALFAVVLTYRTLKDLKDIGENKLNPKRDAALLLVPFYGLFVFYRMTRVMRRLAEQQNLDFKFKPSALLGIFLATAIAGVFLPTFLYPVYVALISLPWLLLHQQMNSLRNIYAVNWHQPPNQFNWPQRCIFILGIPLMGLALLGYKNEFQYFMADNLEIGQSISGDPIYSLTIPDRGWRKMKAGSLFQGTNLELVNKGPGEWVVVHVQPRQQLQTIDTVVDIRKSVIAANWKDFKIDEKRSLDSGGNLIPLSIAYYTQPTQFNNQGQMIVTATTVTEKFTIEVIGQSARNANSSMPALVKSLKLASTGNKP